MASITKEELREEIVAQLEGADLDSVSAKKVRQALEKKFDEDLSDRKKEIDDMITEVVREKGSGGEDEGSGEEEEEEEEEKPAPKKRKAAPRKEASDSEEEASGDDDDEEEYAPKKKRGAPKKRTKKADSDEDDWRASKKPAAKKAGGAKKGGGGTGYTKQLKLSPELSKLMGETHMARHEVIKKMWSIIKEKNMYDPKNKQFAICDEPMLAVIGVKRFKTFGMMKYLKDHFIKEE